MRQYEEHLSRAELIEAAQDDELLAERAEAGWRLLRAERAVDPYEVLAAIVWPTPAALEAQVLERRRTAA